MARIKHYYRNNLVLTEHDKVVVVLPFSWEEKPTWYRNCVISIACSTSYNHDGTLHAVLVKWFKTHYDAELRWLGGDWRSTWRMEFPNRENYMECVLTWS